jgi:membrane-bound lytic murein transglycosylase B
LTVIGFMLVLSASPVAPLALAQSADSLNFSRCIAKLQDQAKAQHLPAWVIDDVMAKLKPQPRVLELDRAQPEFTQTFADYLYRRVTKERIQHGRQLLKAYRPFLHALTKRYGVPGRYLIAFWGLETNFGAYLGTMPTLDSLATLACDQRRSDYFSGELMTALTLLNRESLRPTDMKGSWAGAVGHTQFMPSAYLKYAVDGDHDGHINLWKSKRDALASAANFLAKLGWRRGGRWGREVLLPDNFPYVQTGLQNRQALSHWAALGVTRTDKRPLPAVDIDAAVLLPAGHTGPAFLVYDNFDVIMKWNRSEFYGISVGLLADRLIGAGGLARPPSTTEQALSRTMIERIQGRLNHLGFAAGAPDGVIGPATRAALRAFQKSAGIIPDGYPDTTTLTTLEVDGSPSS